MAPGPAIRAALCSLALWLMALSAAPAQTAVEAWVQRYSDPTGADAFAQKVVTDNAGNVIVGGYTDDGIHGGDVLIIKYSGAGVPLWTNRYNGPGNSTDEASAAAVDGSGNVFVTGFSVGSDGDADYATIKYTGGGVPLWTNRYDGPGHGGDYAKALAVDGNGDALVTGWSHGIGFDPDYATVKYSGGGVPLWTNRYNGAGNFTDQAYAVAVDGGGNVFVTGRSASASAFPYNDDYATIKYSGGGVPLWTNRYNGPGNELDQATAAAVDGSGNVFVTGWSASSIFDFDYATVAYSGAGVPLWTNRYEGPGQDYDDATAVAVDGGGTVFVTGRSLGSSNYDYATVAYSGAGVPLWTNRYNGPGNSIDSATAVAVDGSGNVFVTGWSASSIFDFDYATVAYSGAGVPLWTNRYDGPANGDDQPLTKSCLAIGPDGAVYVTGASERNDSDDPAYDYATIKYIYSIPLHHQLVGNQLVLSWANAAFRLQSAPAVHGDYTDIPGATSPHSTGFSGPQRFFRLKAN